MYTCNSFSEHHKIKLVKIPTWFVALATFGLVSVVQPCTTLCKSWKDFCKKTDAFWSTFGWSILCTPFPPKNIEGICALRRVDMRIYRENGAMCAPKKYIVLLWALYASIGTYKKASRVTVTAVSEILGRGHGPCCTIWYSDPLSTPLELMPDLCGLAVDLLPWITLRDRLLMTLSLWSIKNLRQLAL